MSDIFISYASADRERAKVIAESLAARGWSVWWDRVIPPGREFDEVIEEALDAARCVVVLWSQTSVASRWVKTESAEAMRRKALIPVLIDNVKIPLEFRRLQAADLSQWHGEPDHPALLNFFQSLETHVRDAHPPAPPATGSNPQANASADAAPPAPALRPPSSAILADGQPPAPTREGRSKNAVIAVAAIAAMIVAVTIYYATRAPVAGIEQNALAAQRRMIEEAGRKAADERRAADEAIAQAKVDREDAARETTRRKAESDIAASAGAAAPSPRAIAIGGLWRDATGGIHQIRQSGTQFEIVTANPTNGYASQGRGIIKDGQIITDFQTNLPSTGRAIGTLSADGQSISGTVADSRLGQYGLMIYR